MDGEPRFPAGSRRARVALLVAGAVVLAAAAVGVRAALGGAGGHDRQPGEAAGVAAAGTTIGGQAIGATVARAGGGEVKTCDIPVRYAFVTVHVKLDDTVKGSAASPTETVVDRLHVLAPPGLHGQPVAATMTHTVCP